MKYRIIDYTSCRGDWSTDSDEVFESSLDIDEVALNLLKDRFQEMYDKYKEDGAPATEMIDNGFLAYYCEFFSAQPINDSVWGFADGEEQGRILIAENSEWFNYPFPTQPIFDWPDDGFFKVYNEYDWVTPSAYDFESLTGIDPYKTGWEGFDCAKALADAGIIKL